MSDDGEERVGEREHHGQTHAHDEGRINQAEKTEHLGLQKRTQLPVGCIGVGTVGPGFSEGVRLRP